MSFTSGTEGKVFNAGYFLGAPEGVLRETRQASQSSALVTTLDNGAKYIKGGTPYPTNDGNAIGIVYEDVDVTNGDMPCSVVTAGTLIYEDRLPVTLETATKNALIAKGFTFANSPAITRP